MKKDPRPTAPLAPPGPNISLEELRLPARVYRSLKTAGFHTVGQVAQAREEDLLRIRHFGRQSLRRLKARLRALGVTIRAPEWMAARDTDLTALLGMPIEQCGFSDAMLDRLRLAQIDRLGELVARTPRELLRFPSLGPRSLQNIQRVLNDLGLALGMDFVPADADGNKWMDRLDLARERLAARLPTAADRYFFAKHAGISQRTLRRFFDGQSLSAYESSKLRRIFKDRPALDQPWDIREVVAYQRVVRAVQTYRETASLLESARRLRMSHEQVRQLLKLARAFKLEGS